MENKEMNKIIAQEDIKKGDTVIINGNEAIRGKKLVLTEHEFILRQESVEKDGLVSKTISEYIISALKKTERQLEGSEILEISVPIRTVPYVIMIRVMCREWK